MAVNVKLGVDLGSFNSSINEAKAQIKSFDAALKFAESSFKATGDAEAAMTTKTQALNGKLSAQKNMVQQYANALQQMQKSGVDPMSTSYQKLQAQMLTAQAAMMDTQAALNGLDSSQQQAANSADQLTKSVNGIGKKISLDQVISGINRITDGLEAAAKTAVHLGETLWNEVMEQASKADDIATKALMYDMTPEQYQRVAKMAATWAETSVEQIMRARQRVQGRIGDMTETLMGIGVDPYINKKRVLGTKDQYTGQLKDWEDIFWETGEALMNLDDKYKQANAAQEIFGQKWESLKPMFEMGREAYEAALNAETVASNDAIDKLSKLNDTVNDLKSDFESLEQEVLAGMAPALTGAAEVLDSLLAQLMEYLQKPEGQAMLERMETAVSELFTDLANIDPEDVVNNFVSVFDTLVNSFTWIKNNWSEVKSGLTAIVGVWAVGKVTSGALSILQMLNGLKGLTGGAAAEAGAAAGASWGTAFANAVAAAAPWLVGAYALLKPAEAADDSFFNNQTGQLTQEGWRQFEDYAAGKVHDQGWDDIINLVGDRYGGLSDILGNTAAINAMAKALYGDHYFPGIDPMAQPEAYMQRINNELFDTLEGMGYEPKIEIVPSEEVAGLFKNDGAIELTVGDPTGRIKTPNGWKEPELPVDPEVADPEAAAAAISAAIGTVTIGVVPAIGMPSGAAAGALAGNMNLEAAYRQYIYNRDRSNGRGFANGIAYVPGTQLAWLHEGERVLTARDNRTYTANSNLYVERMIMNNGQDAAGLAAAMAAQNRRVSAGFGS